MRFTTIMGAVVLGLSTAALAQVAGTPAERKPQGNGGGNDMAVIDNAADSTANDAAATPANDAAATSTTARSTALTPQTGDPTAASSSPRKP